MMLKKAIRSLFIFCLLLSFCLCSIPEIAASESAQDDFNYFSDEEIAEASPTHVILENVDSQQLEGTIYKAAEDEHFTYYLDTETLALEIIDKETDKHLASSIDNTENLNQQWSGIMLSGITLEYMKNVNTTNVTADLVHSSRCMRITHEDKELIVDVFYPDIGLGYKALLSFAEGCLTVDIPRDSLIHEASIDDNNYAIAGFYIYPMMGFSEAGAEGYMFIPDGQGALISLEANEGQYTSAYSELVYGNNVGVNTPQIVNLFDDRLKMQTDVEIITMPVFGVALTDRELGFLSVVESGDANCRIEAYPNGVLTPYNWVAAHYTYRQIYIQPTSGSGAGSIQLRQKALNQFDIEQKFYFLRKDDANYNGMARVYRHHLFAEDLEQRESPYDFKLDYLMLDQEQTPLAHRDIVMTTFADVANQLTELKAGGIERATVDLLGFAPGGRYASLPIKKLEYEKNLGGEEQFHNLQKTTGDLDYELGLELDLLRRASGSDFILPQGMKQQNRRIYIEKTYKPAYSDFTWLQPKESAKNLLSLSREANKQNIDHFSIRGITDTLFSHYDERTIYDRSISQRDYLAGFSEADVTLYGEQACAYLWPYLQGMTQVPLSSSGYAFIDQEIPFLSMVLKGKMDLYGPYQNFQSDQKVYYLKLIETGVRPSFLLTQEDPYELQYTHSLDIYSSRYDVYAPKMTDLYQQLKPYFTAIEGSSMTQHERVGDVVHVAYDNGVNIYLNYSEQANTYEDLELAGYEARLIQ